MFSKRCIAQKAGLVSSSEAFIPKPSTKLCISQHSVMLLWYLLQQEDSHKKSQIRKLLFYESPLDLLTPITLSSELNSNILCSYANTQSIKKAKKKSYSVIMK